MSDIEIIAEIGVNHNGSVDQAQALIDCAHSAGCDTVKFQLFHGGRYPELQLTVPELSYLRRHALASGLKFLCTPDDLNDAYAIKDMGCDRIKIGSSNVTNIPLLEYVATLDMDVILSTGACYPEEIDAALDALMPLPGEILPGEIFRDRVVMHCVSAYPSPVDQLNLRMIDVLRDHDYAYCVGYSDHTIGSDYQSALVALGLGARVFEKHFTAGHWMRGPDHKMSADIFEMKRYVAELRTYARALGSGVKGIQDCELENRREYAKFVEGQQRAHGSKV